MDTSVVSIRPVWGHQDRGCGAFLNLLWGAVLRKGAPLLTYFDSSPEKKIKIRELCAPGISCRYIGKRIIMSL